MRTRKPAYNWRKARQVMRDNELSQGELARLAQRSRSAVNGFMTGRTRDAETARRIGAVLNLDMQDLRVNRG